MEGSEEKFWTNSPPSVGVCFLQFTCSVQIFKPGGGLWCWRGFDCEIPAAKH